MSVKLATQIQSYSLLKVSQISIGNYLGFVSVYKHRLVTYLEV